MIFTNSTRLMAGIIIAWGVANALIGLSLATGIFVVPSDIGLKFSPAGKMIDKGIYAVLVGLAMGTLAEIGLSVRRGSQ